MSWRSSEKATDCNSLLPFLSEEMLKFPPLDPIKLKPLSRIDPAMYGLLNLINYSEEKNMIQGYRQLTIKRRRSRELTPPPSIIVVQAKQRATNSDPIVEVNLDEVALELESTVTEDRIASERALAKARWEAYKIK